MKTESAHPNVYTSCAAIKNDGKETEHQIDLANLRRQVKRRNYNFEQKQGQRQRLKDSWRESTIDARSYMTARGALNLRVVYLSMFDKFLCFDLVQSFAAF